MLIAWYTIAFNLTSYGMCDSEHPQGEWHFSVFLRKEDNLSSHTQRKVSKISHREFPLHSDVPHRISDIFG